MAFWLSRLVVLIRVDRQSHGTLVWASTGNPGPYSAPTFGQELAEMLGQAFVCAEKREGG